MRSLIAAAVLLPMVASAGKPAFFLPEKIHAAPGLEVNVYFKNVFSSVVPQNYAYRAESERGRSELARWCWTPEEKDAGSSYRLVVEAWSDDGLCAAATTTVEVAAAPIDPARRMTMALFADSLTNCGYQNRILADMRTAGFTGYQPVGSRKGDGVKTAAHDGFGGYTCTAFLSHYKVAEDEWEHIQDAAEREQLKALGMTTKIIESWQRTLLRSPLVRFSNGQKVVDVPAWLDKVNGGRPPDVVVIELGVNDVFHYRGEVPEIRARIRREVLPSFRKFIDTLRPFMPKAHFAVTTIPNGCSQDGFAANYGSGWNEIQHRKIIFALNSELAAFVKGGADEPLELIALGNAVDPVNGFIRGEVPANAVSSVKVLRDRNAVHPGLEGGYQMGDAIAAWLRCRWNNFCKARE